MGNGILLLVTGPPQSGREVLLEAGHGWAYDKRRRTLDRMLMHPVLYLETGAKGSLTEDRAGAWDRSRAWKRHA